MVNVKTNPSEKDMVNLFIKNNEEISSGKRIYKKEVRIIRKSIDFVELPIYSNNSFGEIHAIEFKVSNWKSCLDQALCNRILVPKNTVAIWNEFTHRIKLDEFIKKGIGLIEIYPDHNKLILKPKKSKHVINKYQKSIKKELINNNR